MKISGVKGCRFRALIEGVEFGYEVAQSGTQALLSGFNAEGGI